MDYARSIAAVTVCLYLPFSWLFFVDGSWEYKWRFIKWIPWMSGNFFTYWGCYFLSMNLNESSVSRTIMAVLLSVIIYLFLVWAGKKNGKYLVGAYVVSLAITIPTSLGVYGVFKM